MRTNSSRSSSSRITSTPSIGAMDRRQRTRLRDLCDEVLASFRMARQPDQFSAEDRAAGKQLVTAIASRTR
jgi:hypothetical protein